MLNPKGNFQELRWSICTPSATQGSGRTDITRICPTTPALPQAEDPPVFPLSPILLLLTSHFGFPGTASPPEQRTGGMWHTRVVWIKQEGGITVSFLMENRHRRRLRDWYGALYRKIGHRKGQNSNSPNGSRS